MVLQDRKSTTHPGMMPLLLDHLLLTKLPFNLAISEACQYKNQLYDIGKNQNYDYKCDEPISDTGSKFCIFHDISISNIRSMRNTKKKYLRDLNRGYRIFF
jgi:hypothetical protein